MSAARRRPAPRALAALCCCVAALVGGCGSGAAETATRSPAAPSPHPRPSPRPSPTPPRISAHPQALPTRPTLRPLPTLPTLPRGGRVLLPRDRVVAYYGEGYPGGMGLIDVNDLESAAGRLELQAAAYAGAGRPVQPAFELIVTDAVSRPGPDGSYSIKLADNVVDRYLAVARRHRFLLVLDFQPGRDAFLAQLQRYERFLRQPDVGVGLDPEWRTPDSRPYAGTGHTTAAEVNACSAYLAGLVAAQALPQKLLVIHQFTFAMLPDREAVTAPPGLAVAFHMDGLGGPALKTSVYGALARQLPFFNGFKVFPTLDKPPMDPASVMALRPQPDVVTYQ